MKRIAALLFCFSGAAFGQSYGDWLVVKDASGYQIAKTSSGQSVIGVICFASSSNCSTYISSEIGCDDGASIPMLINASTGSIPVTATCTTFGAYRFNVFTDFSSVRLAFESGGEIGFAMPLRNGQFKVIRFSTAGAIPAIRDAMTLPAKRPAGNLREETL